MTPCIYTRRNGTGIRNGVTPRGVNDYLRPITKEGLYPEEAANDRCRFAVIALAGVGVGIGNIFCSGNINRSQPVGEVFGIGILGFALTEAIAFSHWLLLCCFCSHCKTAEHRTFYDLLAGCRRDRWSLTGKSIHINL